MQRSSFLLLDVLISVTVSENRNNRNWTPNPGVETYYMNCGISRVGRKKVYFLWRM